MNIAIITCNINNYEYYKEFTHLKDYNKLSWFYITDKDIKSQFWNVINIKSIINNDEYDNRLLCKYSKMKHHIIFPTFQYYVWIDSSFPISNDNFVQDIINLTQNNYLVLYQHNSSRKLRNIRNEAIRCSKLKSVNKTILEKQINDYKDYNDPKGILYSSGIFIRKNDPKLNSMFDDWFFHNKTYTTRDQISLPYVLFKHNISPSHVIKEHINKNTLVGPKKMKPRSNR